MSRGDEQMWINATKKLETEVKELKAQIVTLILTKHEPVKKVIVKVMDYVITNVQGLPKGATLELHNYDFPDEAEEHGLQMEVDNDGDKFEKITWVQGE